MSIYIGFLASSLPSGTLLLDAYPNAAGAYSTRKLRTAYSGSAVRVRRDSDNTEQDIGFTGNNLNIAALTSFIGSENYLYWSQDFTQTIWPKTAVTVTANAGTAPDGTNTANNCVISAAVTTKAIYQTVPSVSTRDYVFSIYAKANGYNYAQLMAIRDSTNRYSVIVDLTTGIVTQRDTVGTPNYIGSSVTSVGNGWYRITITLNINLGTNYFVFSPSPVANPTLNASLDMQSAGNGTSGVLFWGAQLNYSSLKTYQVTTTAQAILCSGFITKWYDQSGNSRDLIQATAASQPRIYNTGVLETINSKPVVYFDTIAKSLSVAYGFPGANSFIFDVLQSNDNLFLVYHGGSGGSNFVNVGNSADSNTLINLNATVSNYYRNAVSQTAPTTRIGVYNLVSTNSQSILTYNLQLTSWAAFAISGYTSYEFTHYKQELVIYNTDQTSTRANIESNINNYFNIYWNGATPGLLNTYTGAAAAYSLRNLNSAYTGPLIRVRRSSDNSEIDIYGLYNGTLDTSTLLSFAGGNNVAITTWYDQSGNGRNLTRTTAAYQPVIVSSGVLRTIGTTPAGYFIGSSLENTTFTLNQPNTYFLAIQTLASNSNTAQDRNMFDGSGTNRNAIGKSSGNTNYFMYAGTLQYSATPSSAASSIFTAVFNGASSNLFRSGTNILANANPGSAAQGGVILGGYTSIQATYDAYISEFLVYNSNQTSNRAAIEANMNAYSNLYWDGTVSGLLNTYSGAAVAYSLRNLSSAYTGPLIRVRRSSDNAELDIYGFRNGNLDTSTLLSFAGAGSAFITTWYDQSGNARHAVQATTANQPTIVLTGSVYYVNSKPAILFNGSTTELRTSTAAAWLTGTAYSIYVVDRVNTIKNDNYFVGTAGVTGLTDKALIAGYRSSTQVTLSHYSDDGNFTLTQAQVQRLHAIYFKNPNSEYFINNGSLGTQTNPAGALNFTDGGFQIGRAYGNGALNYDGYIQEVFVYPSNQLSNGSGIATNINSYYTI